MSRHSECVASIASYKELAMKLEMELEQTRRERDRVLEHLVRYAPQTHKLILKEFEEERKK